MRRSTGHRGLGFYIQLAQVIRGRALPEQHAVLCVEHVLPLAVSAGHCSQLDQNPSRRTSENVHVAKFEQIDARIGVHVVQISLDLLSEGGDRFCASFLFQNCGHVFLVILAAGHDALGKAADFVSPVIPR